MIHDFLKALTQRRSRYDLTAESPIPDDRIRYLVEHAVKHVPSAFNGQSARVVVLFDRSHGKLWDITLESLRRVVPAEQFSATEAKIQAFRRGHGTLLFFEDQSIVQGLQRDYPLYRENFPVWSQQSSGMHQFAIWTALAAEGLGASLQHYGELIETEVKETWDLPESWKLIAQMPFGKPAGDVGEKAFLPLDERVLVFSD